ncbi:DUF1196 domain-containing protein [Vibrio cholerae]|nr:DUF1196 domain-containing protein [Vibrio cholerae]EGQ9392368.1 DUF1196 domain-containing protein [Vibrio cholerae]EGR0539682.1 DUF1196 domain-containing protein [Vibrio cholerae]EGR2312191.1 DUF1196 domain-containing protein [Vibrio cholerae]EGR3992107.1 DUF1196 domain-containing protein [Vibrio cholerae]
MTVPLEAFVMCVFK